jgi:hypothetical protein
VDPGLDLRRGREPDMASMVRRTAGEPARRSSPPPLDPSTRHLVGPASSGLARSGDGNPRTPALVFRTLVRMEGAAEWGRIALSAGRRRARSWRSAAALGSGCASAARPPAATALSRCWPPTTQAIPTCIGRVRSAHIKCSGAGTWRATRPISTQGGRPRLRFCRRTRGSGSGSSTAARVTPARAPDRHRPGCGAWPGAGSQPGSSSRTSRMTTNPNAARRRRRAASWSGSSGATRPMMAAAGVGQQRGSTRGL